MVNLDKPVVVRYQGQTVFKGRLSRSRSLMAATLRQRGDARYMFSASYEFRKISGEAFHFLITPQSPESVRVSLHPWG